MGLIAQRWNLHGVEFVFGVDDWWTGDDDVWWINHDDDDWLTNDGVWWLNLHMTIGELTIVMICFVMQILRFMISTY